MDESDVYTKEILKINNLRKQNLSLEVVSELRRLYHEYQYKRDMNRKMVNGEFSDNSDDMDTAEEKARRNGYDFLMGQVKSTLYYMIREHNGYASDGAIRRLTAILDNHNIVVSNLITVNNHAIVFGKKNQDFSNHENIYLNDLILKEINDYQFINHNQENTEFYQKMKMVLQMLLKKINNLLSKIDSDEELKVLSDRLISYSNPNLHIYLTSSLYDITRAYFKKEKLQIEVMINYQKEKFYTYVLELNYPNIIVYPDETNIWKLSNPKSNSKRLTKTLESYAFQKKI